MTKRAGKALRDHWRVMTRPYEPPDPKRLIRCICEQEISADELQQHIQDAACIQRFAETP